MDRNEIDFLKSLSKEFDKCKSIVYYKKIVVARIDELSKLHQPSVISEVCENEHCHDGIVIAMFGENYRCGICEDKQTDL